MAPLKNRSIFQVNTRVRIVDEENRRYYHSTIQEVEADSFFINEPLSTYNEKLKLPVGSRWRFHIIAQDALYVFISRVRGYREDQVMLVEIEYPEEVSRWQRREFVRLSCSLETEFWLLKGEKGSGDISERQVEKVLQEWYRPLERSRLDEKDYLQKAGKLPPGRNGYTVDISGGGVQLTSSRYIPEGGMLLVYLQLGSDSLMLKGKVCRTIKMETKEINKYRIGVEFIDMEEKVRDLIISYIFEEMRRRMR